MSYRPNVMSFSDADLQAIRERHDYIWQSVTQNIWVFGRAVRGLVREKLAEVRARTTYDFSLPGWDWEIYSAGKTKYGRSDYMDGAVDEVERILGLEKS